MSASRWQTLPEKNRGQVLALLARMIAKGALVDSSSCIAPEADDA
ncbi:hypothetical protein [Mycobacterium persicum]|nr:hypothetical protein [Mycobacterium persicum]